MRLFIAITCLTHLSLAQIIIKDLHWANYSIYSTHEATDAETPPRLTNYVWNGSLSLYRIGSDIFGKIENFAIEKNVQQGYNDTLGIFGEQFIKDLAKPFRINYDEQAQFAALFTGNEDIIVLSFKKSLVTEVVRAEYVLQTINAKGFINESIETNGCVESYRTTSDLEDSYQIVRVSLVPSKCIVNPALMLHLQEDLQETWITIDTGNGTVAKIERKLSYVVGGVSKETKFALYLSEERPLEGVRPLIGSKHDEFLLENFHERHTNLKSTALSTF